MPKDHGMCFKVFESYSNDLYVYTLDDGSCYVVMKTVHKNYVCACALYKIGEQVVDSQLVINYSLSM